MNRQTVRVDPVAAPPHRRSIGLRARAAIGAALAALVVAAALSSIAYFATRSYLVDQRESAAVRQAFLNARLLQGRSTGVSSEAALGAIRTEPGGLILLYERGTWLSAGAGAGPDDLPATVREAALAGESGHQRAALRGATMLFVVAALPDTDVSYIEIFPLGSLEDSMSALRWALVLGSVVAATGGAMLGIWASRRALRPLATTATVASRIAAGSLHERVPDNPDADLAKLGSAFNGMAEVLQRRLERESRFASDVSHELRTPLATLSLAAASLERRRDELSERSKQALDLVVGGLHDLERLVIDLLDLARAEQSSPPVDLEEVPLAATVRTIVREQAGPHVSVTCTSSGLEDLVVIDRRRLERVLGNLLDNAARHAGGAVAVTLVDDDHNVRMLVDDDGPGIAADDLDHIFDRFVRGGSTQDIPGSGLGLALVREHVRAMGGTVTAQNRAEGGARFTVTLPRRQPPTTPPTVPQ